MPAKESGRQGARHCGTPWNIYLFLSKCIAHHLCLVVFSNQAGSCLVHLSGVNPKFLGLLAQNPIL